MKWVSQMALGAALALAGATVVAPPLLEYVESLLVNGSQDMDLRTFKLVDQLSGRTMGLRADITPQVTTTNPAVNFSTTAGSPIVSIVDVSSNTTAYDVVIIETQVSVGGIILYGAYQITQTQSSDLYQITAASNALNTVANSGSLSTFTTTTG